MLAQHPRLGGFFGLGLLRLVGAMGLFQDDLDLGDILVGLLQVALGDNRVGLEAGNARRFLEQAPALVGVLQQDLVDLALGKDRIGGLADTGIHEQVANVAQVALLAVEKILVGAAVAENAALDLDFRRVAVQYMGGVVDGQSHFGKLHGLAFVGTIENDVVHAACTQSLGGLFTQNPLNGVDDIAFPAAVGPEQARDSFGEIQMRLVGKRLEPVQFQILEKQTLTILDEISSHFIPFPPYGARTVQLAGATTELHRRN